MQWKLGCPQANKARVGLAVGEGVEFKSCRFVGCVPECYSPPGEPAQVFLKA